MKLEVVDEFTMPPDVDADVWCDATSTELELAPVPLSAVDTSKYVRDAADGDREASVDILEVEAVHDGDAAAFRLTWGDDSRDDELEDADDFVDKAAVAFPVEKGASIMTMGSETAPVNAWYWRADSTAYDVVARGVGTTERRDPAKSGLETSSRYDGDRWQVVFSRSLESVDPGEYADLTGDTGVAFAVWEGDSGERGPNKSYSGEFGRLVVE